MKIKNNRDNFVTLQIKHGTMTEVFNIVPNEELNITHLTDLDQVINSFLFRIGNLSVITDSSTEPVIETQNQESKVEEKVENTSNDSEKVEVESDDDNKDVSGEDKVHQAIKSADDFMSASEQEEEGENK